MQRQKMLTSLFRHKEDSNIMRHYLQSPTPSTTKTFQPIDLSAKWDCGVVSKVRSVRVAAFSGKRDFEDGDYRLAAAVGVLQLTGHREGAVRTELLIGFSNANDLPQPTFHLDDTRAFGTMSLAASSFGPLMQLVHLPNAHFRISSDVNLIGVASDPAMLLQTQ